MPRNQPPTAQQNDRLKDPSRRRSEAVRWALLNPSRRQLSRWEREQRKRNVVIFGAIAMAVLSVAVLLFGYVQYAVLRAADTVAVVHGERITAGDLLRATRSTYQAVLRQQEVLRQQGMAQQAQQLAFQVQSLPNQVLNSEVEQRLIRREAEARGISVSDEEVQTEIRETMQLQAELSRAQLAPEAGAEPSPVATLTESEVDGTYQDFLQRTGFTEDYYRTQVRQSLLREKVREAVVADLPTSMEQVHARHILVSDEERAKDILARLQAGASFDELAEAESQDPGSKSKGGDLGWFPRGVMNAEFESAAFSAEPSAGPQIVRSPNGWHVLDVVEKSADRPLEQEDRETLETRRFQEWLQAQREAPEVNVELSGEESGWVLDRLQSRIF